MNMFLRDFKLFSLRCFVVYSVHLQNHRVIRKNKINSNMLEDLEKHTLYIKKKYILILNTSSNII